MNLRRLLRMTRATALFALALLAAADAHGESLTWRIKSDYPYKVWVEFYSMHRDAAWPGAGKAYPIADYAIHTFRLNCNRGEKICYGAWNGDYTKLWGVGHGGRGGCSTCCYVCNGGKTDIHLLENKRRR